MLFKYFKPPFTSEALKQQFRDQCKTLHPDAGGDAEKFKEMRAEFDKVIEFAARGKGRKKVARRQQVRPGAKFQFTPEEKEFIDELRAFTLFALKQKVGDAIKRFKL